MGDLSEIFALLSVAGFATQRTLELLDPFFIFVSKLKLFTLLLGDEKTTKTWCMAFVGFGIGLLFAVFDNHTLPLLNPYLSDIVLALAISTGSNAANSLMKFGENVKESRKKEVQPLPELKLAPGTVTVSPNARIQFLASVSGTDNKEVTWRVLEVSEGGTVMRIDESTAEYTAPGTGGTYHVAAISEANPAASATATITVRQP
jgi:hypothetical protein